MNKYHYLPTLITWKNFNGKSLLAPSPIKQNAYYIKELLYHNYLKSLESFFNHQEE